MNTSTSYANEWIPVGRAALNTPPSFRPAASSPESWIGIAIVAMVMIPVFAVAMVSVFVSLLMSVAPYLIAIAIAAIALRLMTRGSRARRPY